MRATATSDRPIPRSLIIVGAAVGMLAAVAVALWARFGGAVFHEMLVAGLALCF